MRFPPPFYTRSFWGLSSIIQVRYPIAVVLLLMSAAALAQQSGSRGGTDDAEYQSSLKDISQQIQKVSNNLNANRKLIKNERDKLSVLEQKIAGLETQRKQAEENLRGHEQEKKRLDQEIADLNESQQRDRQSFDELLMNRLKNGTPNFLQLLVNQDNPHAAGRLSHYYRYLTQAQQRKLQTIGEQLRSMQQLKEAANANSLELEKAKLSLVTQADQLAELRTERQQRIARLDQKIDSSKNKLKQLQADRQRLNKLIAEVAKQAARMRRLEDQRRENQSSQQTQESKATPIPVVRKPVKGGFSKQRGRLNPPVVAQLEYRYGNRLPSSGLRAQGHFYRTQNKQPVSAVFRGNVLFADYLKGYGLLLIIDHGDQHISLYGHNEVLYKRVGDAVQTGETVAISGTSGGLKQPGLYFEIRRDAAPVDPKNWLSK